MAEGGLAITIEEDATHAGRINFTLLSTSIEFVAR